MVEQGHGLDQVGQCLGPQAAVTEGGQQLPGPFRRMRRTPATDVPHAREDDARRDAAPDAVGDGQLAFCHQMPDVVREPRPGRAAVQPVGGAVVPLDQRVAAVVVRQARERHAHIPHYAERPDRAANGFPPVG
jgi:hypothetical protein